MGRRVLYFSVCWVIFQAPMFAADWTRAVEALAQSTVYIETKGGSCTGFVINTVKRDKERTKTVIMTAAHCDGPELYADQTPAEVVWKDTKKDLMLLEVNDLKKQALALAPADPVIGDIVASYGFGYSLERPLFRVAHISDDSTYIHEGGVGGPFFVIDAAFVGGMSGGPVVNQDGEVVMIVQRASDRVGLGIGAKTIRQKTKRFWASQ
jgi:S1-C subfamily serine protease